MVAHVVLYRLRADVTPGERAQFNTALVNAFSSIPEIRRYRVGRRLQVGAAYETTMSSPFEYFGLLEFDDMAGLQAYLAHPSHVELGRLFWSCSERTLVIDYELAADLEVAARGW